MQEAHEFLDAAMLTASAPEEAFQRFDVLAARHVEALRQLTKKVQDARLARDTEALKTAVIAYEEALEAYIPGTAAPYLVQQPGSASLKNQKDISSLIACACNEEHVSAFHPI